MVSFSNGSGNVSMRAALLSRCILFAYAVFSVLFVWLDSWVPPLEPISGTLLLLLFFSIPVPIVFNAILHFQCWKKIPRDFARLTPGKAVGFLFIPFYALYWLFPSIGGLGATCAIFAKRKGLAGFGHLRALGMALAIFTCVEFVVFAWGSIGIGVSIVGTTGPTATHGAYVELIEAGIRPDPAALAAMKAEYVHNSTLAVLFILACFGILAIVEFLIWRPFYRDVTHVLNNPAVALNGRPSAN
jgi:hypothetical protein